MSQDINDCSAEFPLNLHHLDQTDWVRHIFLCLDSDPKLIEKILMYIRKRKDLQFVLERTLTPCSVLLADSVLRHGKKARLHSVIYIILFVKGP